MRTIHASSRAWRRVLLTVAALLLVAACGDDAADDDAAEEPEAEAAGEELEAPEPDESEDDAAEEADAEEGDFEELLAAASDVALAITYEGEDETGASFELSFAQDPPASALIFSDDDEEARMVAPGDGSFVTCGIEGGQWQCIRLGVFDEAFEQGLAVPMAPFLFDLDELADAAPGWVDVTSATVAGRAAQCASSSFAYGLLGDEVDGRSEVCVDDETGAMLSFLSESSEGVLSRVEATEVGDPDPSLFEPPAEPMDLEDMFGDFDPEDMDFEDFDPEDFDPEDFGN